MATRGAQAILEGYARTVARGGAGRTMRENIQAMDALVSAGKVSDGNSIDGTTRNGGKAYDHVIAQFPNEELTAWAVPAPLLGGGSGGNAADYGLWVDLGADPFGVWNQTAAVTRNTMLGIGAGVRLDTAHLGWNTFLGYQAGNAMTGSAATTPTSTENVMIGTLSGANQPSGDFNTYVGNVTGWGCNYDSDNCTYLGMDVFRGSPEIPVTQVVTATVVSGGSGGTPDGTTTVTGTTGTGSKWQGTATITGGVLTGPITVIVPGNYTVAPTTAGDAVTSGSLTGATCALTLGAGFLFNAGSNNTGVGARVMRNGSFDQCCSLGAFTMQYQNTTGALVSINNSIAIGFGSMTGDPTALGTIANCVSVGWYTGANLGKGMPPGTTVQGNVFVGTAAGRYVQSGNFNTLVGYNAGSSAAMTANAFVTCVGANTAASLTTGNQLTVMGYNAASALTTGNANNIFGYQSGLSLTTGSFNHFFGNSTGSKLAGGNRNTLIGHLAGSTNLTSGSDNIIVGYGLDTVGDASSTINIGNTFMATIAGGPTSNARIDLAGFSVAFANALISNTAGVGVSIDVPSQLVTAVAVAAGGSGYVNNDTLHDANGGRYTATVTAGAVTGLSIVKPGIAPGAPPSNPVTLTNGSKTTSSNQTGSGCTANLTWAANKALQLNKSANDVLVSSATLSNSAVVGFLGLPASSGVPTGTPTNAALGPLLEYNKSTHTINVYDGSAWFHVTLSAAAA